MKGYKDPGFQHRAAASQRAKNSALEKLKAMPKPDAEALAAGAARQAERDAKAAAKREALRQEKEAAKRLEEEKLAEAERQRVAALAAIPTEAERKAARDARYAARKKRKS